MTVADIATVLFVCAGILFFVAGTAGLLRFPDFHSRLHALTKADNLGLGLVAVGVAIQFADFWTLARLVLVWLLAVLAAATVAQLVARSALDRLPDADGDEAAS